MVKKNSINIIAFAVGAFLGGIVTGLLLSPKSGRDNRKWITDNTDDFTGWADQKSRDFKTRTDQQISHLKANVKKGVHNTMPDLYEATQDFGLKDEDLQELNR